MASIDAELDTLLEIATDVRGGDKTANDTADELEIVKSDIQLEWSNLEEERDHLQEKLDELEDKINNLMP